MYRSGLVGWIGGIRDIVSVSLFLLQTVLPQWQHRSDQSIAVAFRWISSTVVPHQFGISTRDNCIKIFLTRFLFWSQVNVLKKHLCQKHLQISDSFTVISSPNKEFIARNENIHADISTWYHHHENFLRSDTSTVRYLKRSRFDQTKMLRAGSSVSRSLSILTDLRTSNRK